MLKFKKFFIAVLIVFMLSTSCVFATDATIKDGWFNDDLSISKTGSYYLTNIILGNAFITADEFIISPEENGGSISGDLFAIASTVQMKSNSVADSENTTENSSCTVYGNAYVIAENFVLESGSEIQGDLYVIASKMEIQEGVSIQGNIFGIAVDTTLDGQVKGSVYLMSENCTMDYSGFVYNDLHLESTTATLNGYIYRNAYINSQNLTTSSKFSVQNNLELNSEKAVFAGQVLGNATMNSKSLEFDTSEACTISGNLNYSTKSSLEVSSTVVSGEITKSEYVEVKDEKDILDVIWDYLWSLITLLIYVFAICLIIKYLAPKYIEGLPKLSVKGIFASIGIGLLSIIAVFILTIFLWASTIATLLGFILLLSHLILLGFAVPVLIYAIANALKEKLNWYALIAILTTGLYVISLIPVLGGLVSFFAVMAGAGMILKKLLTK